MGNSDIFVAKFDSSGVFLWAKSIGNIAPDDARNIELDGNSNIIISGTFMDVLIS
ncbi:MAG: hypothetical protein IPM91_19845 [Bacteroidetes bacterium]|nr:hypothetical protein [Bacteroidota bacterium]